MEQVTATLKIKDSELTVPVHLHQLDIEPLFFRKTPDWDKGPDAYEINLILVSKFRLSGNMMTEFRKRIFPFLEDIQITNMN